MYKPLFVLTFALLSAVSPALAEEQPAEIAPVQAATTTVKLTLDPMHPTRKQETTVVVSFIDAQSGKAADVEDVLVEWSMDGKKHANKFKLKRTTEPGVFQGKTIAPMNGKHNMVVTAVRDGQPIAATFETHVMDLTRGMKDTMGH